MSEHPYHHHVPAAKRHLDRIKGRIERYQENVEYFTKHPDSAALALNRSLLETDKRAWRNLTGKCYQSEKWKL